jgi:NAD(P)-dependent dehydrogenase (short-subunit alcohol dehydrogenase family)
MLRERSGAIVNVSSVAAIRYTGYPYVAYYAAKAAVNNFTMGLALQYANEGIRVNAIIPGLMNTPLIHQQISGQYKGCGRDGEGARRRLPDGPHGQAWDIAKAALFLASDDAQYITGVSLPVRRRPDLPRRVKEPCDDPRPHRSGLPARNRLRSTPGRGSDGRRAIERHVRLRAR